MALSEIRRNYWYELGTSGSASRRGRCAFVRFRITALYAVFIGLHCEWALPLR